MNLSLSPMFSSASSVMAFSVLFGRIRGRVFFFRSTVLLRGWSTAPAWDNAIGARCRGRLFLLTLSFNVSHVIGGALQTENGQQQLRRRMPPRNTSLPGFSSSSPCVWEQRGPYGFRIVAPATGLDWGRVFATTLVGHSIYVVILSRHLGTQHGLSKSAKLCFDSGARRDPVVATPARRMWSTRDVHIFVTRPGQTERPRDSDSHAYRAVDFR